jgi:hypothetical protein
LQAQGHEDVVHVVVGDVDVGEVGVRAEGGGDGAREVVGFEVEVLEALDVGEVGGDVVAQVGVVDGDPDEVAGEAAPPGGRDGAVEEHPLDLELLQVGEPAQPRPHRALVARVAVGLLIRRGRSHNGELQHGAVALLACHPLPCAAVARIPRREHPGVVHEAVLEVRQNRLVARRADPRSAPGRAQHHHHRHHRQDQAGVSPFHLTNRSDTRRIPLRLYTLLQIQRTHDIRSATGNNLSKSSVPNNVQFRQTLAQFQAHISALDSLTSSRREC